MAPRTFSQFALFVATLTCVAALAIAAPPQSARDHYQRGNDLARAGKFDEALAALNRAAELDPKSPQVQNLLGVVLTQLGRLEEADAAYSRALALDASFEPARKNRAVNAFTRGKHEFAAQEFGDLARLRPRDAVPRLFLGLDALRRSDFPAARAHLLEARRLGPDNTQVLLALARTHFALGEREQALEAAERFGKLKGSAKERFEMGALLEQFGAHNEAAQVFAKLREEQPGSNAIGFNLALSLYRADRAAEALEVVDQLLAVATPTGELLNLHGRILNRLGRFAPARESLRRAIEAEPRNADHYLDLSTLLSNAGDSAGALRVVEEGLAREAEPDRLRVQLGLLHLKQGKREEAESAFRSALDANPLNRSAYLALATLFASGNRSKDALDLISAALRRLPEDPFLHYLNGGLLLNLEDASEAGYVAAEASLRTALRLNPYHAGTHYLLGRIALRQGDLDSARAHLEKAVAFDPAHAAAYFQLGSVLRRQGHRELAAKVGEKFQELTRKADEQFRENFEGLVEESLTRPDTKDPRPHD